MLVGNARRASSIARGQLAIALLLGMTAATGSSRGQIQTAVVAGVMRLNGTHHAAAAGAGGAGVPTSSSSKLSSGGPSAVVVPGGEGVIQRQSYVFPSEYETIDCGVILRFSNGLGLGPVPVSLRRDESTSTTRCALVVAYRFFYLTPT